MPGLCHDATIKKKRSRNQNATPVNLRCVRNLDDQQSNETALEGEVIKSLHSKILREVFTIIRITTCRRCPSACTVQ